MGEFGRTSSKLRLQDQWEEVRHTAGAGTGDGCRLLLIIALAAARFPVEQAAALAAELLQVGLIGMGGLSLGPFNVQSKTRVISGSV